jgi:hypothetical protein
MAVCYVRALPQHMDEQARARTSRRAERRQGWTSRPKGSPGTSLASLPPQRETHHRWQPTTSTSPALALTARPARRRRSRHVTAASFAQLSVASLHLATATRWSNSFTRRCWWEPRCRAEGSLSIQTARRCLVGCSACGFLRNFGGFISNARDRESPFSVVKLLVSTGEHGQGFSVARVALARYPDVPGFARWRGAIRAWFNAREHRPARLARGERRVGYTTLTSFALWFLHRMPTPALIPDFTRTTAAGRLWLNDIPPPLTPVFTLIPAWLVVFMIVCSWARCGGMRRGTCRTCAGTLVRRIQRSR